LAQYDINLREYWRILKKRKLIIIIIAILLGVFSTFFAIVRAPAPLYSTSSSIKFEKELTLEGLYARTLTWSGTDDIESQMSLIKSYSVMKEVAAEMGLIPREAITDDAFLEPRYSEKIESLQSRVKVLREDYTDILNIIVTHQDPNFTQKLANTIVSIYKIMHAEQQNKRTEEAINYIDDQLEKTRQRLKDSENEFNEFSQKNQLLSIDMQSENLLLRKKDIQDDLRKQGEIREEVKGLLSELSNFAKDPSDSNSNFYSANVSHQYEITNDKLVELLLSRDTLLENFTHKHPEVIATSNRIVEYARKMMLLLDLRSKNLDRRRVELNLEIEDLDRRASLLMEKKVEFDRLRREVETATNMTALLEEKHQEAQIRRAEKPEEVIILKRATLPAKPINTPKYVTTGVMGIIIGVVLGLILAFIVETFDTSVGTIEDVEETLGARVLGVIPQAEPKDIQARLKDRYPDGMDEDALVKTIDLVSHFAPKTMIAESFRALRTNVQFREGEDKIKTIAVTSTSPQEGKTTVSINLAISLAQAGLKTLLVGSDLRKPMLGKIFGLEIIPGLTDILLGNYPWPDTVKSITDIIMGSRITMDEVMLTPGMDNLHIITSGTIPPNPAELIDSKRLMDFIEESKKEYDIVIFDSAPVLSTADAAILGTRMDGVLIVYRVGAVSRGLLKRSSAQLEQVKCNIIGVILNGMKPDISPDFQDFKYYKHYYAYEEDTDQEGGIISRILSFMGIGKGRSSSGSNNMPSAAGKSFHRRQEKGSSLVLKWLLILLALICIAAGVLWKKGF
jgi:capsular exopolysaccharide synthesis family protein